MSVVSGSPPNNTSFKSGKHWGVMGPIVRRKVGVWSITLIRAWRMLKNEIRRIMVWIDAMSCKGKNILANIAPLLFSTKNEEEIKVGGEIRK